MVFNYQVDGGRDADVSKCHACFINSLDLRRGPPDVVEDEVVGKVGGADRGVVGDAESMISSSKRFLFMARELVE